MHTSHNADVFLSIDSTPIIEHCTAIRFTAYPSALLGSVATELISQVCGNGVPGNACGADFMTEHEQTPRGAGLFAYQGNAFPELVGTSTRTGALSGGLVQSGERRAGWDDPR